MKIRQSPKTGFVKLLCCRSSRKEAEKERQKKEEMDDLRRSIQELFFQAEQHATQIREMTRLIGDLGVFFSL